jgi:ATP-dependent DNA helicase RecG
MLDNDIQYLKGVGPKRAVLFRKLGIGTVRDLLYHPPRRYLDRSQIREISAVEPGQLVTVFGKVADRGLVRTRRNLTIVNLLLTDSTGYLLCRWFNQPYLYDRFQIDDRIVVSGTVLADHGLTMSNPEYELLDQEDIRLIHTGRIVPLHPATAGLSAKQIRTVIKPILEDQFTGLEEPLPETLLQKYRLPGLSQALHQLHFPDSLAAAAAARSRLAFEELLYLELVLLMKKRVRELRHPGCRIDAAGWQDSLKAILPFSLTQAQERVIGEISHDLSSGIPMHRLLQGDVGSGKTVVALAAIIQTIRGGFQASLMAPTELLAEQHYYLMQTPLERLGIRTALLTGRVGARQKEEVRRGLQNGEIGLCLGTQALIQDQVTFQRLGLAVIDEQHRFGVRQRATLRFRGANPHVLVMTATPIPRTLAMTLYGDLDLSVIDQLPGGRQPVVTKWTGETNRNRVYQFIEKHLSESRQAYVVYPVIEETEKQDLRAAIKMHQALGRAFPNRRIGLLHGQLTPEERRSAMEDFRNHATDILVSTTVIEVGIDVPNASLMVVEHAERFGLSQLHQLRGRVGRGQHKSFCILMAGPRLTPEGRLRLETMQSTSDGFKIAERDLELRGPGEFWSTRQHGLPQLKIADLTSDAEMIKPARDEAAAILAADPGLSSPHWDRLRTGIRAFHPQADKYLSTG